jgi:ornithine decarboxylase
MTKQDIHSSSKLNSEKTPFLEMDLEKVREAYVRLKKHLGSIELYYAMKCNPNPEIMKTVFTCGAQFEISSAEELKKAMSIGADPKKILFSNPVKTIEDIKYAHSQGLNFFAFDSLCEIDKIAEAAPKAKVSVRIAIPVRRSEVASEGKFGVSIEKAYELSLYARERGLKVIGVSFHVGSQMLDYKSWNYAIGHSSRLIKILNDEGFKVKILDIGGGFPALYDDVRRDNMDKIGKTIRKAIDKYIPSGIKIVAEPGRYLVACAGVMHSSVIGVAERFDKKWIHLDIGASNGLMEALQTTNNLAFPISDSKNSPEKDIFVLTGPTCDSQDTILFDVPVSSSIEVGDRVYIGCAGAYTTAFTENFNGFPNPTTYVINKE